MGLVALPEMKRYKYEDGLATGSVAAGGTLGFLIPPSGGMIIYAVLTEQSIGRLFMAGVFPGIILTLLFIGAIYLVVLRKPDAGPPGPRASPPSTIFAWNRARFPRPAKGRFCCEHATCPWTRTCAGA